MNPQPVIEPHVYEHDPSSPGRLTFARSKTVAEVLAEIRSAVGEYPEGGEEYLSAVPGAGAWPREGRTVVFPVEGSSEGHYVHVEVYHGNARIPRRLADLLGV